VNIHANATALDAALDAVKDRWERVFCLGDIVDYGPDPNEVTERVKELSPVIIRGNHDKAVAGLTDLEDFNPMAQIGGALDAPTNAARIAAIRRAIAAGPISVDGIRWFMEPTRMRMNMCLSRGKPWAGFWNRHGGNIFRAHAFIKAFFLTAPGKLA